MDKIEYWRNCYNQEFKIVNGKLQLDNLNIEGHLDLRGCTSLLSLPDNLSVNGDLILDDCTSLLSLPDNLTVNGYLELNGCISLVSLPDNLTVGGGLDLNGCTSLKHIGKNIYELIIFDQYEVSTDPQEVYTNERIIPITGSVRFSSNQPETIKLQYVGKRLINLIDDPRIYGTRYAEAIITGLDNDGDFVIEIEGQ